MKPEKPEDESALEPDRTGLPWPATWTGAYLLVIANFVAWIIFLAALTVRYR